MLSPLCLQLREGSGPVEAERSGGGVGASVRRGDAGRRRSLWALHELLVKHFYLNMVTRVKCGRLKHLGVSVSS